MPRPRPPSRVDTITFPVFGVSWFGDVSGSSSHGTSIVAFCGGGGSAKTGVTNKIVIRTNGGPPRDISTGEQVCVAVQIYQNPITHTTWLMGAVSNRIVRYALLDNDDGTTAATEETQQQQEPCGEGSVGDEGANAVAVNAMADRVAVGCETGSIHIFSMTDESNDFLPLMICRGHEKAVCAMEFAIRVPTLLVSSAKDGTARLWNYTTGDCLDTLQCSIQDPKSPPPSNNTKNNTKRPLQILVRGCKFGDLEGTIVYTVASGRRGKAFLSQWVRTNDQSFVCQTRTECSPVPVSAMSLSGDQQLLALGGVDGTVTLFNVHTWKVMKKFMEIHDLPVTGIAARPYPMPLRGEDDGIVMHAMSASADSQLAWLTLQTRAPRQKTSSSSSSSSSIGVVSSWMSKSLLWMGLVAWASYHIALETIQQCDDEWNDRAWMSLYQCFVHSVLIAPPTRPGILVPPH